MPPGAPPTLGVEFSGTVFQLGPGLEEARSQWKVGDEVLGLTIGVRLLFPILPSFFPALRNQVMEWVADIELIFRCGGITGRLRRIRDGVRGPLHREAGGVVVG